MKTPKTNRRAKAIVAASIVALLTMLGSSALTASNTVPDSKAGDGAGAITGYQVSSVSYNLNATDPQNIDQVSFTLDSTPAVGSEIRIRLVSTGSTWYSCTNTLADVTCITTTPVATVAAADELRVVAVD